MDENQPSLIDEEGPNQIYQQVPPHKPRPATVGDVPGTGQVPLFPLFS
jgi:hypothetical protein